MEKRLNEFKTGRLLARKILEQWGILSFPLLSDQQRCPIWPPGVVGSITHTDSLCIVALARSQSIHSLGIDVESVSRVKQNLWSTLLTEGELSFLEQLPAQEQQNWVSCLFSLKEAFFKYQFPLTRRMIGFDAIEVQRGEQANEAFLFQTRFNTLWKEICLEKLVVRYALAHNCSFAAVWEPSSI